MDINYLLWLQSLREASGGALDGFFLFVSDLAHGPILVMLMAGVYWCVCKEAGEFLFFSSALGSVCGQYFKNLCCVYRPWIRSAAVQPVAEALKGATGYSFPSVHAISAASQFGGLALWYRAKKLLFWLLLVLVLLVAFSRNYLGVHTPQDVVVGLAIGAACAWCCYRYFKRLPPFRGETNDLLAAGLCAAAGVLLIIFVNVKNYPLDYNAAGKLVVDPARMRLDVYKYTGALWGVLAGWLAERRLVRFRMPGSPIAGAARFAAGMALYFAIARYLPLCLPFAPKTPLWNLAYHFLINFYLLAVWPALFAQAERRLAPNTESRAK